MKTILLALLAPLVALAQTDISGATRKWTESQAASRAAPTLNTEGAALQDVTACRLTVCAPSGEHMDGGSALGYVWDNDRSLWVRAPDLDELLPVATGRRCEGVSARSVAVPSGRLLYATNGVTNIYSDGGTGAADGGANISVQLKCSTRPVPNGPERVSVTGQRDCYNVPYKRVGAIVTDAGVAVLAVAPCGCAKVQCNVATYVGQWTNATTACAATTCEKVAANDVWVSPLSCSDNNVAALAVSGTATCQVFEGR